MTFALAAPQDEMGLDIRLFETGTVTAQFFEPDHTPFTPVLIPAGGSASKTFRAPSGHFIGGVTLTNVDVFGVSYDNLRLMPGGSTPARTRSWGTLKSYYR